MEILGVETEFALKDQPNNLPLKFQVSEIIKENYFTLIDSYNPHFDTLKSIKQKSVSENVVFSRADKGNSVVATNKFDYINKTLSFFDNDIYTLLNKDPTFIFKQELKSCFSNSKSNISPSEQFKLLLMNPQAPKLYSLIKLNKTNFPIRPVVSFVTAPAYKLSRKLIQIILHHTNFTSYFSVKNSQVLINNIKVINIPNNAKLISFDVQYLFPSIPLKDTIILVEKLLFATNTNPVIINDILCLLIVCLKQNYFQFQNKIYSCSKGLIMGNPLSLLLAEIL